MYITSLLFLSLTSLVFIVPLICFYLFPSQVVSPPLRSLFLLHLTGLCPPMFLLFICSCVWIELSTSASGAALKIEKKQKNTKVQFSWAVAPEGSSHTIQQARGAFALKPLVLEYVEGERCVGRKGSLAMNLSLGLKDKELYWGHNALKTGKSELCNCIQTEVASKECHFVPHEPRPNAV